MVSSWETAREELRAHALRSGWAALGVTGVEPFAEARRRGLEAVAAGRMDGMPWMTAERMTTSADIGGRLPWARSLVALAWPYRPVRPPDTTPQGSPSGRVAAYALLEESGGPGAADYHDILARRCDELVGWLRERFPEVRAKRFVDHGWAIDRAVAERAGIGFVGKHASLLTSAAGSYVLLAEIALSLPLPPDRPSAKGCGTCTACLPACPTGAIVAPGVIDARRCISYLTIEHHGPIPHELRPLMGSWVFGCDLCQEACPVNHRRAPAPGGEVARAGGPVANPDLVELLELDETAFVERFAGSAVTRTGRARMARNAATALGNCGDASVVPALRQAATEDPDQVVREAAQWAIGRLSALGEPPTRVPEASVEQPDGHAEAGRDRRPDARRHDGQRVARWGPPGVGKRAADGNAVATKAAGLPAQGRSGHRGQRQQQEDFGH